MIQLVGLVAVVLYGVLLYVALTRTPGLLVVSSLLSTVPVCLSLIYLERGIYVVEQMQESEANLATLGYVAASVCFLVGAWIVLLRARTTSQVPASKGVRHTSLALFVGGSWVILIGLALNLSMSPIPLLEAGIDRFDYWRLSRFPWMHRVLGDVTAILAFNFGVGAAWAIRRRHRWLTYASIGGILAYFAYLLLIGHKFSALLLAGVLVITSFWCLPAGRRHVRPRLVVFGLAFVTVLLGSAYYNYRFVFNPYESSLNLNAAEAVAYRALGLQGHVWWGSWDQRVMGDRNASFSAVDLLDGMRTAMGAVAPHRTEMEDRRDVRFTMAFPAILLLVFPIWFAFPALVGLGAIAGALAVGVVRNLKMGHVWRATVLMQLSLWFRFAVTNGSFSRLFSVPFALIFAIAAVLVAAAMISRLKHRQRHKANAGRPDLISYSSGLYRG